MEAVFRIILGEESALKPSTSGKNGKEAIWGIKKIL
jgi:hypothetical protein